MKLDAGAGVGMIRYRYVDTQKFLNLRYDTVKIRNKIFILKLIYM